MENLKRREILEDEEDIREGLKALADEEDTATWEQYQRQRAERELRVRAKLNY